MLLVQSCADPPICIRKRLFVAKTKVPASALRKARAYVGFWDFAPLRLKRMPHSLGLANESLRVVDGVHDATSEPHIHQEHQPG
jgi:hypothetical protein